MKNLKIPKMGNQKEEGQATQYIVLQLPNEKKKPKGQTMINKPLHREQNNQEHEHH